MYCVLARSCIAAALLQITLTMLTADKSGHARVCLSHRIAPSTGEIQARLKHGSLDLPESTC